MNKLESFRQQHNFSYRNLARLLGDVAQGFSKSSVHRLCLGLTDPTPAQAHRIAAILTAYEKAIHLKSNAVIVIPAGQTVEVEFVSTEGHTLKHLTITG